MDKSKTMGHRFKMLKIKSDTKKKKEKKRAKQQFRLSGKCDCFMFWGTWIYKTVICYLHVIGAKDYCLALQRN